ncbi:MAG TPA: hypothetical protein DEA51_05830 [Erysipelotrichaceae bacterium]|nr:hypothetical protein [Erysipelotrichaceae bacterium]
MALDGICLHTITQQLQTILPLRINKIYQLSPTEVVIQGFNQRKYTLILSTHSIYNRIQITDRPIVTPEEPSGFVMLLRKHLEGGLIMSIQQLGLDRLIHCQIENRNDLGDKVTYTLAIELMGKYANIILIDSTNMVLDALKRIPPFENNRRTLLPNAQYRLPEPHDKKDPFSVSDVDPHQDLQEQFHGFSPLLAREIQHRMIQHETFDEIMKQISESTHLYITKNAQQNFHVIPLTHLSSDVISLPLMEGFDYLYAQKEEKERIKQQTGDSFKVIKRELKRLKAKLPKLYAAMDEAKDCEKWKEYGEYCYAYLHLIQKGASQLTVERFDSEGTLTIPLDPKFDGKQNAKRFFQKYQKGNVGQAHIDEQIDKTNIEIQYLEGLAYALEIADVNDAKEIREELAKRGYMTALKTKVRRKKKEEAPNFLILDIEGATLYVGKNNIQNDYVTFKLGRKEDYWFHAKDTHGSHVVVVAKELNEHIIRTAAQFAAYYSKARHSSSVPVNYTKLKEVKKIPNAPLGLVRIGAYQTIYIDPDTELIQQIQKEYRR